MGKFQLKLNLNEIKLNQVRIKDLKGWRNLEENLIILHKADSFYKETRDGFY